MMPKPCGHIDTIEGCIACRLNVTSPEHEYFWRTGEQLPGAKPVSTPKPPSFRQCQFLADEPITAGETARIGLPTIRQWKQCAKGHGTKGTDGNGYICGCMPWPKGGCNGCPDYVASDVI